MRHVVTNSWALLLGMAFIMLGNGLQGSLLGVRAMIEGFSVSVTGLVMSGYFLGLVAGSIIVPKIIRRVGHVRTFGALASLASVSILVHLVLIDPWVWWVMRVCTGFAYAGLYIVTESWLNDAAENETRGQLLSLYMLITLGGMAGGQFMLNISSPEDITLFILISVLVSIAVIPILISAARTPAFESTESVSVMQLFRVSPLGVFGIFGSGMASGSIFGVGAVFATRAGFSIREVSFFMGCLILGAILLQFPIGWLSDKLGRRKIIVLTCFLGALVFFALSAAALRGGALYLLIALAGGLTLPLYSLCIAYTNDHLNASQMVAASGALVLANGLGASLGAPTTAFVMDFVGPEGFYQSIGFALTLICLFAVWRATRRQAIDLEQQGEFVAVAPTPLSAAFNPELELAELQAATGADPESVQASFEELIEDLDTQRGA